jgi:hypothetical protein
MRTVAERLRELAATEETLTVPDAQTWPEYVERTYHVGRQSAFIEAAKIAEQQRLAVERGCKAARR